MGGIKISTFFAHRDHNGGIKAFRAVTRQERKIQPAQVRPRADNNSNLQLVKNHLFLKHAYL